MSQTVPTAGAARAPVRHKPRLADGWISTPEAEKRANVSKTSLIRWMTSGVLAGAKIGGRWRVSAPDLDRLLSGDEADPAA